MVISDSRFVEEHPSLSASWPPWHTFSPSIPWTENRRREYERGENVESRRVQIQDIGEWEKPRLGHHQLRHHQHHHQHFACCLRCKEVWGQPWTRRWEHCLTQESQKSHKSLCPSHKTSRSKLSTWQCLRSCASSPIYSLPPWLMLGLVTNISWFLVLPLQQLGQNAMTLRVYSVLYKESQK